MHQVIGNAYVAVGFHRAELHQLAVVAGHRLLLRFVGVFPQNMQQPHFGPFGVPQPVGGVDFGHIVGAPRSQHGDGAQIPQVVVAQQHHIGVGVGLQPQRVEPGAGPGSHVDVAEDQVHRVPPGVFQEGRPRIGPGGTHQRNIHIQFVGDVFRPQPERVVGPGRFHPPPPQRTGADAVHPGERDAPVFGGDRFGDAQQVPQAGVAGGAVHRDGHMVAAGGSEGGFGGGDQRADGTEAQRVQSGAFMAGPGTPEHPVPERAGRHHPHRTEDGNPPQLGQKQQRRSDAEQLQPRVERGAEFGAVPGGVRLAEGD